MTIGVMMLIDSGNKALKAVGVVSLIVLGIMIIPTLLWWFFGRGKERFISYFEGSNKDEFYGEDDASFQDSFSQGSSITGGTSVGGYEVKYKNKDKTSQQNQIKTAEYKENSLRNVKPKKPGPPKTRKRLKKSRARQPINTRTCCTEINACGVGV